MVLLPRAVTPLLARRTRRYRTRDAGVQTNRELCDTKRIITSRLDRSYVSYPLPSPIPFAALFSLLVTSSLTSIPHACNNIKLFVPLYVNFRKCALSLLLVLSLHPLPTSAPPRKQLLRYITLRTSRQTRFSRIDAHA